MKRKTVIAIAFMAILLAPLWAQTERDFEVTLTGDSQGVVIARYTGTATAVRIPATIQGMPVRVIGSESFSWQDNRTRVAAITSVVIPEGVTTIAGGYDSGAFMGQSSLTTVTLPSTLTSIGYTAFRECTALTTITLPSTLTSIGNYAFSRCSALRTINLPNSLREIGEGAFASTGLTSVNWPASITTIEEYMFSGSRLQSIVIPEGVTRIKREAFQNTALTSVTLPSTITHIGWRAFITNSLTTVNIPNTVERIYFPEPWGESFIATNLLLASQANLNRVAVRSSSLHAWNQEPRQPSQSGSGSIFFNRTGFEDYE